MLSLRELFIYSNDKNASDIHLSTGLPPILRIDGDLVTLSQFKALTKDNLEQIFKEIYMPSQLHELAQNMELDASFKLENVGRYRSNAFFQLNGPSVVFRAIPETIPSFEDIGAPAILPKLANTPNGLILITGATGAGKSTTLATMINYINQCSPYHIITIEDPIEFIYKSKKSLITQREIHRSTRSFQSALRSALREDPDVILVGELRDLETIRLALTAAETGHLVLATLHTVSAAKSINRIIDVFEGNEKFIIRTMLAETLQGIISQVLFKSPQGGRVAAFEVLIATTAIRNLIRDDKIGQMHSVMQFGREEGMQTLDQALKELVKTGQIHKADALPYATFKPDFL